jgi:hypothetical protein
VIEVAGSGPQGATGVIAATPPITYDAQTKTVGFDGALSDLSDVDTDGAVQHDLLAYDGTEWKPTDTPHRARPATRHCFAADARRGHDRLE